MVKIAPSILSADFSRLGDQIREVTQSEADYIHIDVMDGHFVPNITIGPLVVKAIRPLTSLPLDVHLMIEAPERYLKDFAQAGADILTVHVEACPHLHRVIQSIKELKVRAGVAINPATPLAALEDIQKDVDLILIMSVNPGFGGQTFIEGTVDKIARQRQSMTKGGLKAELEVDGGINRYNVQKVVSAGANVLVAGAAVFNNEETVGQALQRIREASR